MRSWPAPALPPGVRDADGRGRAHQRQRRRGLRPPLSALLPTPRPRPPSPRPPSPLSPRPRQAYKTLTDEAARTNYEKYGHPDGPQSYSVGVALPSWVFGSGKVRPPRPPSSSLEL